LHPYDFLSSLNRSPARSRHDSTGSMRPLGVTHPHHPAGIYDVDLYTFLPSSKPALWDEQFNEYLPRFSPGGLVGAMAAPDHPLSSGIFHKNPSVPFGHGSSHYNPPFTTTSQATPIQTKNANFMSSTLSRGHSPDELSSLAERLAQRSVPLDSSRDIAGSLPSESFISLDSIDDDAMASGGFASVHVGRLNGSKVNASTDSLN
jgi:hypothetical protein